MNGERCNIRFLNNLYYGTTEERAQHHRYQAEINNYKRKLFGLSDADKNIKLQKLYKMLRSQIHEVKKEEKD